MQLQFYPELEQALKPMGRLKSERESRDTKGGLMKMEADIAPGK